MELLPYLHRIAARQSLSPAEASEAMHVILGGRASTPQIAAFLVALHMKGETPQELLGFAAAMREKAARVDPGLNGQPLLDTCGTGGDGAGTFNISTMSAFVAAAAGARVAKHGNRSISSQCGSADILEALGVRVGLDAETSSRAIREVGIGFLFAPVLHPAMKYAQPARQELKMRTVFNLLGPLTNPAGASAQLIGAPSESAAKLMAHALAGLEPKLAFVVHGAGGLDEVSTVGATTVYEVRRTVVRRLQWTPGDFGMEPAQIQDLRGGDRATNCAIALHILEGRRGPHRDIVVVNAAAALVAAGKAANLKEGVQAAAEAIDSGAAQRKLRELAEFTNQE